METLYDIDAVLERLLHISGCRRDAQLAALLSVSPQAISQARKKRRIPESWLVRLATRYRVPLDWLLYGEACDEPRESDLSGTGNSSFSSYAATFKEREAQHVAQHQPLAPAHPVRTFTHIAVPQTMLDSAEPVDIDVALVPLVTASLSAGTGSLESGAEILDYFAFRQNWLCRKGDPDKMILMKVHGNSMDPVICHGDMVLIDQGKTRILGHTIYAVGVNEEIYVKQVETLPGNRMLLRSLNERYDSIEVDLRGDMADSVRIIGKVIWWCREA